MSWLYQFLMERQICCSLLKRCLYKAIVYSVTWSLSKEQCDKAQNPTWLLDNLNSVLILTAHKLWINYFSYHLTKWILYDNVLRVIGKTLTSEQNSRARAPSALHCPCSLARRVYSSLFNLSPELDYSQFLMKKKTKTKKIRFSRSQLIPLSLLIESLRVCVFFYFKYVNQLFRRMFLSRLV